MGDTAKSQEMHYLKRVIYVCEGFKGHKGNLHLIKATFLMDETTRLYLYGLKVTLCFPIALCAVTLH